MPEGCEADGCRQEANTYVVQTGVGNWILCPRHAEDLARGRSVLLVDGRNLQRVTTR